MHALTALCSVYCRGLKLKLLRGAHEDVQGNPRAALWPEVAGVTFSDSDSASVPKFLNPGPTIV